MMPNGIMGLGGINNIIYNMLAVDWFRDCTIQQNRLQNLTVATETGMFAQL
jgi:hypothetical protein